MLRITKVGRSGGHQVQGKPLHWYQELRLTYKHEVNIEAAEATFYHTTLVQVSRGFTSLFKLEHQSKSDQEPLNELAD